MGKKKEPVPVEDNVLSIVHELQAPLTGLRARIEKAFTAPWCGPECRAVLESCLEDLRRASQMLHDLLLLERAEASPSSSSQTLRLEELASEVVRGFVPSAAARRISLVLDELDTATVSGDREEIRRILTNLVDNAVRYTSPGGTIRIRLALIDGGAELRVVDDGPGIAPEHQTRVFERFYQVDREAARENGGVGLGLAIARSLAIRNGAQVLLESTPGKGSTFLLRVPLVQATL